MNITIEMLLSICLGVGLAASAGFRVFIPLFILSLASFFGFIPLSESWQWVASTPALIILGVASVVESISYLVPFVDNALDSLAIPLAGIAGTLVMASTLTDLSPALTWALAIVAGGGAATTIQGATTATRAVSSATTAGVANPVVSVAETGTAIGLSVLSIFAPILAIIAAGLLIISIVWFAVKAKRKSKMLASS